jgi:hypothetical protein
LSHTAGRARTQPMCVSSRLLARGGAQFA